MAYALHENIDVAYS